MAIYYTRRTRGSDLGAVPRSVPTARTARTRILSLRSGAPLRACAARTRVHIGVCLALIAVTLRWARVGHRHACRMSQHLGLLFARAHGPCAPTTDTSLLHACHPPCAARCRWFFLVAIFFGCLLDGFLKNMGGTKKCCRRAWKLPLPPYTASVSGPGPHANDLKRRATTAIHV